MIDNFSSLLKELYVKAGHCDNCVHATEPATQVATISSRVHTRAESGSNRVHTTISCEADPDRIPIESGLANPPREVDSIWIRPRSGLSRLIT